MSGDNVRRESGKDLLTLRAHYDEAWANRYAQAVRGWNVWITDSMVYLAEGHTALLCTTAEFSKARGALCGLPPMHCEDDAFEQLRALANLRPGERP